MTTEARRRYLDATIGHHRLPWPERFWAKVDTSGECWLWTGSRKPPHGYGEVWVTELRTRRGAHRVSWELANGPIPDGLDVLHRCDNPPCVRPDHLWLGDARANVLDAVSKGRLVGPWKGKTLSEAHRRNMSIGTRASLARRGKGVPV